jgi:hypothetical protein
VAVFGVLLVALAQLGCGGGHPSSSSIDLGPFKAMAQKEFCARDRNALYVIDDRYVLWAREDNGCADANFAYILYGRTPDEVICRANQSLGGPRQSCQDQAAASLFNTATDHLDAPDLGLGADHRVQKVSVSAAPR